MQYNNNLCYHQVHHHVHRADFDRVDSVNKLPDLFKGGSVGGVMRATSPDQLWQHTQDKKTLEKVNDRFLVTRVATIRLSWYDNHLRKYSGLTV